MKKIITIFMFAFILDSIYPIHMVYNTCTIDSTCLLNLRSAALNAGESLISQYWIYTQSSREEENSGVFDYEREFSNSFGLESRAIRVYKTIINYFENLEDNADILNEEREYLYNFPYDIFKLAIYDPQHQLDPLAIVPSDWDNDANDDDGCWWNLSDYDRARELGYNLIFLSFMVDMLYYAHDPSDTEYANQMAVIIANLDDLKDWVHSSFYGYNLDGTDTWATRGWQINLVYDSNPPLLEVPPRGLCIDVNENMPRFENFVSRYHITCGLGYASLITGDTQMLNNFVRQEFKSDGELPAGTGFHGFNDYMITKSGMFSAGLTYQTILTEDFIR